MWSRPNLRGTPLSTPQAVKGGGREGAYGGGGRGHTKKWLCSCGISNFFYRTTCNRLLWRQLPRSQEYRRARTQLEQRRRAVEVRDSGTPPAASLTAGSIFSFFQIVLVVVVPLIQRVDAAFSLHRLPQFYPVKRAPRNQGRQSEQCGISRANKERPLAPRRHGCGIQGPKCRWRGCWETCRASWGAPFATPSRATITSRPRAWPAKGYNMAHRGGAGGV
jgi:hypothetical protein